jgi:hypothetical protein
MTHPIHDTDDILEALIEGEYQLTQNPDCLAGEHSWQGAGDRIRCSRCKWSPHVPLHLVTEESYQNGAWR